MEKEKNLNNLKYSNNQFLQQAIKVNHAGEYGAIYIYSGQKCILKKSSIINEIVKMEEQERSIVLMRKSKSKKFVLLLLLVWHVLGMSLGVATAIIGKKAAMTCAAAVEEVIGEQYKEQVLHLEDGK